MSERVFWLGALLLLGGCRHGSGSSRIDGPVTLLTTDNPSGEEDDPSIGVDANGVLHVVWFSDRDGTKDLYYLRSSAIDLGTGTITWDPIVQLTDLDPLDFPPPTQGDNYPALLVEEDGSLDLAWHRWNLADESHILFMHADGTPGGWSSAVEVDVTSGANFDRFPCVVRYAADDLRVYFGSHTRATFGVDDVFVSRSDDDGATWSTPVAVDSLNDFGQQTQFPWVVKVSDTSYLATIDRWRLNTNADLLDPSSDVFYATSDDGETWNVDAVTVDALDDQNDITPALYFDHAGAAHVTWATIALGDPTADLVQIAADDRALYPAAAHLIQPALGVPDHSPRILALTVNGRPVFATFWVRILDGHNQVVYRLSSEP